jgi:toxin-antitoxin system PIN domain toxin
MNVALLDVSVLIALLDKGHPQHEDAHAWMKQNREHGWATCPLTINGCIRILSNPSYPSFSATPAEVIRRLTAACSGPDHSFWSDSVSLLDERVFRPRMLMGPGAITDAYLLALAVRNGGRLATFDRTIPVKAVAGAGPQHVALIGASGR